MTEKPTLLIVTEAALQNPLARPLSADDQARVNGVYRTYQNLARPLSEIYNLHFLTPFDYPGAERSMLRAVFNRDTPFALPQQKTIRLVLPSGRDLRGRMDAIRPDHVHIATEGPLGARAMLYCKRHKIPVSTAFHTQWPHYVQSDGFHVPGVPRGLAARAVLGFMTFFHKQADATMAATPELKDELAGLGLARDKIHIVSRGIDTTVFRPYADSDRPVADDYALVVSRLAPSKGIEDFCRLDTGLLKKVVVGTGPLADGLKRDFPDVAFAGFREGPELARYYSGARIFVLPSESETFGITVIESLACGTPVAALDRGGHQPILNERGGLGLMRGDLQRAFNEAVADPAQFLPRQELARHVQHTKSWDHEALNFHGMVRAVAARRAARHPG